MEEYQIEYYTKKVFGISFIDIVAYLFKWDLNKADEEYEFQLEGRWQGLRCDQLFSNQLGDVVIGEWKRNATMNCFHQTQLYKSIADKRFKTDVPVVIFATYFTEPLVRKIQNTPNIYGVEMDFVGREIHIWQRRDIIG